MTTPPLPEQIELHRDRMWRRDEKSERAFRLDELPGLIAMPVGVDEKEIKAIVDRWLR